jgi:hypothetical protein
MPKRAAPAERQLVTPGVCSGRLLRRILGNASISYLLFILGGAVRPFGARCPIVIVPYAWLKVNRYF